MTVRAFQRSGGAPGWVRRRSRLRIGGPTVEWVPNESARESKRAADLARKQDVADAAQQWRRMAAQFPYAGLRGEDTGFAACALLESIVLAWDACPAPVKRDAVQVATRILDGTDGEHDPSGRARGTSLTDGDGH